jgi:MscS family membrane protein
LPHFRGALFPFMKMTYCKGLLGAALLLGAGWLHADEASSAQSPLDPAPAASAPTAITGGTEQALNTSAAAASKVAPASVRTPDFLEHTVDSALKLFNVRNSGNTPTHYVLAALFLVGAILLRRVVTLVIFGFFKRLAKHTETTLDDELFAALETPVATLIVVAGSVCSLKVLKLSETGDRALGYGVTVAFSLVFFWILLRAFDTFLDHVHKMAVARGMGVAAFMPWIKKSLITIFVIFGTLITIQSLGYDVKAFLAGLGIGGLAFALAAQDTVANLFGSVVVAVDQPFKVGEFVRIGGFEGTVEDIGLRSTKLRTGARTVIAIPNKTVAAEAVTNLTRMPQRRVDQTIGLTYDTTPEQMEVVLEDIRRILREDSGVHQELIVVNFANYGASSLDIQIVFFAADPNWAKHMELRERINLKIMKAVLARGLSFAFPTQTVVFDGPVAKKLAERKA